MVSTEEVASFMAKYFPTCPLCGAAADYEVSGTFKNYVQCKSCKAKWLSNDFQSLKELKKLKLVEGTYDGRGGTLVGKEYPTSFWTSQIGEILGEEEKEFIKYTGKMQQGMGNLLCAYRKICSSLSTDTMREYQLCTICTFIQRQNKLIEEQNQLLSKMIGLMPTHP